MTDVSTQYHGNANQIITTENTIGSSRHVLQPQDYAIARAIPMCTGVYYNNDTEKFVNKPSLHELTAYFSKINEPWMIYYYSH